MEPVELNPMSAAEFRDYSEYAIANYAEENIRAGVWVATNALANANKSFRDFIPAGLHTPDNFLYTIRTTPTGETIGIIWLRIRRDGNPPTAHICDILVQPPYRNRGYARQALHAIEMVAADHGAVAMTLHVFAHNEVAQHLYRATGYEVTGHLMRKRISGEPQ